MVKYCENVNCRHGVFSKYFGDTAPKCGDRCDVCKDRKTVEKNVDRFKQSMDSRWKYKTGMLSVNGGDGADLYGGGREGTKREWSSGGGEDDDGGDGGRSREKRAKTDLENAIKKQFDMRKGKTKAEDEVQTKMNSMFARVKAAEFTSGKIAGLDVKTREDYLGLVESSLTKNYDNFKSYDSSTGEGLKSCDILDAAVEAEYSVFTSNKVVTMYRKKVATLIQGIKSATSKLEMSEILKDYKPKPAKPVENLANLVKTVKKEMTSQQDAEPQSSKKSSPPKTKSKGFRLKRETSHQSSISNFFSTASKKEDSTPIDLTNSLDDDNETGPVKNVCDNSSKVCDISSDVSEKGDDMNARFPSLSPSDKIIIPKEPINKSVHNMSESEEDENDDDQKMSEIFNEDKSHENDNNYESNENNNKNECKQSTCSSPEKIPEFEENLINSENSTLVSKIQQKIKEVENSMGTNSMKTEKDVQKAGPKCTSATPPTKSHQKEIKVEKSRSKDQKHQKSHSSRDTESSSDKKMEIADLLVKLLVPYLKNGKITDKPSFKVLAREFTHLLIKSRVSSSKIEKLIAKFFSMQAKSVSEANAKILVREFSISSTK